MTTYDCEICGKVVADKDYMPLENDAGAWGCTSCRESYIQWKSSRKPKFREIINCTPEKCPLHCTIRNGKPWCIAWGTNNLPYKLCRDAITQIKI